jgi:hypothetical protein
MDYSEILDMAKNKLGAHYASVIKEIELRISAGSTGGEIGS